MSIGKQPFVLPVSTVKRETSVQDKILVHSHDDNNIVTFYDTIVDRRIHTQSVKVKFFIVGYRNIEDDFIHYVGRWVELEPYQLDFWRPTTLIPDTYFVGFYPYTEANNNNLHIRLQLFPYPNNSHRGELYIEKLTVMDSEFDANLSWLTDPDIPEIIPPVTGPVDPDFPFGIDPNPNCVWPFH